MKKFILLTVLLTGKSKTEEKQGQQTDQTQDKVDQNRDRMDKKSEKMHKKNG